MILEAEFWDVGQGDCSVVRLPNDELLIIDVGPPDSPLPQWLEQDCRDKDVYGLILTHNDEDHAGCFEGVVRVLGKRLKRVFILQDRHGTSAATQKLVAAVSTAMRRNSDLKFGRIEVGAHGPFPIFGHPGHPDLVIYAVHPDFLTALSNQTHKHPNHNRVSAIICLDVGGMTKIIWAGDAEMQALADTCQGKSPSLLMGPHHGGPIDRRKAGFAATFDAVRPENVFFSVGTRNIHDHPVPDCIKLHRDRLRRVVCTQLTKHCDRRAVENRRHVLNPHLVLGIPCPNNHAHVTCRGPMRWRWNHIRGDFDPDIFHAQHMDKVPTLDRPYCFQR